MSKIQENDDEAAAEALNLFTGGARKQASDLVQEQRVRIARLVGGGPAGGRRDRD